MHSVVSEQLEMSNTQCVRIKNPTWADECAKQFVLLRCENEKIAMQVLENTQTAFNLYVERRHLLDSIDLFDDTLV